MSARLEKIKARLWEWGDEATKGCHPAHCGGCGELLPSDFISKKDNHCVLCGYDGRDDLTRFDFSTRIRERVGKSKIRCCDVCGELHLNDDLFIVRNDYTFSTKPHYGRFCNGCKSNIKPISEFSNYMWDARGVETSDFSKCVGKYFADDGVVQEKYISHKSRIIFIGKATRVRFGKKNVAMLRGKKISKCTNCRRVFLSQDVHHTTILDYDKAKIGKHLEWDGFWACDECLRHYDEINRDRLNLINEACESRRIKTNEASRKRRAEKKSEEAFFAGLALAGK